MGHQPALPVQTLELLAVRSGGFYVDGTVGLGGHASLILERSAPTGRLLGVDRDAEALETAREQLKPFGERARLAQADFRELPALLGDEQPDGVLFDLGVNSTQLDNPERGFSFRSDGPLDMRMDRSHGVTAADVVARTSEAQLAEIIYRYGEEPASRRVARAIVMERRQRPIVTTGAFANIVRRSAGRSRRGIDPATRSFQALRIFINRELEGLEDAFRALARCLAPGGRLVVIAFHSLEDRAAKHTLRGLARESGGGPPVFRLLTPKPIRPTEDEIRSNPRARSARLRGLERVAA